MRVIKAGILDSFQDMGRIGYAHLGVSEGGCMDTISATLSNWLVGNTAEEAVLEIHFPGPELFFSHCVDVAICGGDFGATVNGVHIPNLRRARIPSGSTLTFLKKIWGQRAYLAVKGGWDLTTVLNGKSTHLQAGFGGWKGRELQTGDDIPILNTTRTDDREIQVLNWYIPLHSDYKSETLRFLPGPEWDWIDDEWKQVILSERFTIHNKCNRMGYLLNGPLITQHNIAEMMSSPVLPGTVQLLPDGNLMVLMADAQTTGGYPRILQLSAVDLPVLAQKGAGDVLKIELIGFEEAVLLKEEKEKRLHALKTAIMINL